MRQIHQTVYQAAVKLAGSPKAILDVGCGDGEFSRVLGAAFPKASVTALDVVASGHFAGGRNVSFVQGCVEELPFESNSFDVVVATLSLHHWDDKAKGITEAGRVLREDGLLIIGDPLLEGWMSNRFLGWLAQKLDGGSFARTEELQTYLNDAGFMQANISLVPQSMQSLYLVTAVKY